MKRDLSLLMLLAGVLASALAVGAAQNPPAPPAQFPPRGTGISTEEQAALQVKVAELAARVASLKPRYRSGPMADRVADVEVYLDAVRRPLKYDERLENRRLLGRYARAARRELRRSGRSVLHRAERRRRVEQLIPRADVVILHICRVAVVPVTNEDMCMKRHFRRK